MAARSEVSVFRQLVAYVHCARGAIDVAGHRLGEGDAIGVWELDELEVDAAHEAELIVVEVPMLRGVRA